MANHDYNIELIKSQISTDVYHKLLPLIGEVNSWICFIDSNDDAYFISKEKIIKPIIDWKKSKMVYDVDSAIRLMNIYRLSDDFDYNLYRRYEYIVKYQSRLNFLLMIAEIRNLTSKHIDDIVTHV